MSCKWQANNFGLLVPLVSPWGVCWSVKQQKSRQGLHRGPWGGGGREGVIVILSAALRPEDALNRPPREA